jgi:hypothetical protein
MNPDFLFNPPPGWPRPPRDWTPPEGWVPDPSWPPAPDGWEFWIPRDTPAPPEPPPISAPTSAPDMRQSIKPASPAPRPVAAPRSEVPAAIKPSSDVARLEAELAAARAQIQALQAASATDGDVVDLDDERVLQEVGIYRYHHPLENADAFKESLAALDAEIKALVKAGEAIETSNMFTFDNSLAKGRRMTADLSKLMLRAYNAEADNCVRSLRAGNVVTAKSRLDKSRTAIARLGAMMEMHISDRFHDLRVRELELTSDYLMKVQEEREEAREERERLREERKAEQELAAERERLDKERAHLVNALAAVRETGDEAAVAELEAKVAGLDEAIEQNDFRAANIRAGYVYVISNRGAFGGQVVKIGLTRRLEPLDRIRELGDASVPFPFDVHALFFSEDAVTLEAELHAAFASRRLNQVNQRREFFFATPAQVRDVLVGKVGNLLEFVEAPEATQYLQSLHGWPDEYRPT